MTTEQVRNWLGLYFLITLGALAAYIVAFKGLRWLLPIDPEEAMGALQIVVPTFLGQLTIMFQWFGGNRLKSRRRLDLPPWVIKGPPLIAIAGILIVVVTMVVGSNSRPPWGPTAEDFKWMLTFSVALLNATTVYIVARFFAPAAEEKKTGTGEQG